MAFRKKLSQGRAKRVFRKGARTKAVNVRRKPSRGGIRL